MAVNTVEYGATLLANTDRGPSPQVWKDCPVNDLLENPGFGIYFFDDFDRYPLIGTQTTQIGQGFYKVYNTGAGVVAPITTVNSVEMGGSILRINLDTDNDSGSIAQAYPAAMVTGSKANSGRLWFEGRIAVNSLLVNTMGFMLGLAEVDLWTLAAGVPFNAGDPITNSASFIGWRKGEDALGVCDAVYSDRATAFTNVNGALTTVGAGADATISATYTFIKLGMIYDPGETTKCVRFFVNGVETTAPLSKTTLTGTTNLKANSLGMIAAVIADSAGTTAEWYMDWWRLAQLLPTV